MVFCIMQESAPPGEQPVMPAPPNEVAAQMRIAAERPEHNTSRQQPDTSDGSQHQGQRSGDAQAHQRFEAWHTSLQSGAEGQSPHSGSPASSTSAVPLSHDCSAAHVSGPPSPPAAAVAAHGTAAAGCVRVSSSTRLHSMTGGIDQQQPL